MQEEWFAKPDPHWHLYQAEEADRLRRWLSATFCHEIFPEPFCSLEDWFLECFQILAIHLGHPVSRGLLRYDRWMSRLMSQALDIYWLKLQSQIKSPPIAKSLTWSDHWLDACDQAYRICLPDPDFQIAVADLLSASWAVKTASNDSLPGFLGFQEKCTDWDVLAELDRAIEALC